METRQPLTDPEQAEQRLDAVGISHLRCEPMAKHTTFAIGGKARLFVLPSDEQQLISALQIARDAELPAMVLGRGSNLLCSDDGYDGMILSTSRLRGLALLSDDTAAEQCISAQCGVRLHELACFAAERGLSGLEFAHGIPGTLGGAIRMNAGAYGGEIGALVRRVRCYDRHTGAVLEMAGEQFAFSHRHSLLVEREELVCLGATLALPSPPTDPAQAAQHKQHIYATMQELAARRRASQPLDYPSAGSVFKRPVGHFAGKLIEDCGLKGYRIGGAQVSPKHAGFIVNLGGATAKDVQQLIAHVKHTVRQRFGVTLEQEIVEIGR